MASVKPQRCYRCGKFLTAEREPAGECLSCANVCLACDAMIPAFQTYTVEGRDPYCYDCYRAAMRRLERIGNEESS